MKNELLLAAWAKLEVMCNVIQPKAIKGHKMQRNLYVRWHNALQRLGEATRMRVVPRQLQLDWDLIKLR